MPGIKKWLPIDFQLEERCVNCIFVCHYTIVYKNLAWSLLNKIFFFVVISVINIEKYRHNYMFIQY